jgi:hypothetical protein
MSLFTVSWTVTFTAVLALLLFMLKMFVARKPKFDDIIVAASDLPSTLSAACCSLMIALIGLSDEWRKLALEALIIGIVLLFNLILMRYVESNKLSLKTQWVRISSAMAFSYALFFLISFRITSASYMAIGK